MSDTGLTTESAPSQPSSPAPAAAPPASAPPVGTDDVLGSPVPDDQAVFPRSYVEKVRAEAQRYRDQASQANQQLAAYNDVYGVYADEDRQVWLQLARDWAIDPNRAATVMQQIAQGVLGEPEPPMGQPGDVASQGTPTAEQIAATLSPDQVQQMINDALTARDQTAAQQQAINEVFSEVRAAGYDPDTAKGFAVLYNANHFTGGDIAKAIEMVKADEQRVIDDFVAGRSGRPMTSPSNGFVGTAAPEPIKNIEDARRATEAFLRERRSVS